LSSPREDAAPPGDPATASGEHRGLRQPPAQFAALAIPGVLGAWLVLSSGFDLVPSASVFNGKRLVQVALLPLLFALALAGPLAAPLRARLGHFRGPGGIILAALFGWGMVSAARFAFPGYPHAEIALLGCLLLALPLVAAARDSGPARFDRLALGALLALTLVVSLQEAMGLLASNMHGVEFSYQKMLLRFAHPRFFNQLQTWSLPLLAAAPFVFGNSRKTRALAVAALGLQWCLLLMTGARGSVVALISSLALVALLARHSRRAWLPLHGLGLLAGAALYALVLAGHAQPGAQNGAQNGGSDLLRESIGRPMLHTTGRTHLWRYARADIEAEPWLGVGPALYSCNNPVQLPAHPHNLPLQVAAEWGLPALGLLAALGGVLGWYLLRGLRRQPAGAPNAQVLPNLLAASLLAAAVHSGVSGLLVMPASQMMAVLVGGWALGALALPSRPYGIAAARAWCLAGLLMAGGLAVWTLTEWRGLDARSAELRQMAQGNPRFWQYGNVCLYVDAEALRGAPGD